MVQKHYMLGDPVEFKRSDFPHWERGVITGRTIGPEPYYTVRSEHGEEALNLYPEDMRIDEARMAEFRHREMGDAA